MKNTTIWVSKKLKEKLEKLGKKSDTYEDIIWRLIKNANRNLRDDRAESPPSLVVG